jgi:hypothetical protein
MINCARVKNLGAVEGLEFTENRVLARKSHEAIGLALHEENCHIFFTDLAGAIYLANVDSSGQKLLYPDVGDLTGIAYVS